MPRLPTYSLLKDGVLVSTKTVEGTQEHLVDYEALGYRTSRYASHSVGRLYLASFFTLVTAGVSIVLLQGGEAEKVAPVVWAVISLGFWYYYSQSRLQGTRFMSNVGTFTLLGSGDDLRHVVDEIPEKKRACIEARLSNRLDLTDWRHASGYLVGLRENGIISDEDFDSMVTKYDLAPKETDKVIGFQPT